MAINPVQFANSVCQEFVRYLHSAFPLADPELSDQFKRLLDAPTALGIPLAKGPYVSLSEAFAQGKPVQEMAERGHLHHAMPGLIGYPKMWLHQQQVFETVKNGRHALVSSGTGSGKTEAFLYPILDELLRQRDEGIRAGLAAILIYPMNALANDQLDRLRDMLGGTGISFGQWVGTTPREKSEVVIDRFAGSSRSAYLAERRRRRQEAQAEDRAVRPLSPPEECCFEKDILERQPRILITNYRQLEVLATRLPDLKLFTDAPLRFVVYDEAHTNEGAVGAEVACLIRRIRALSGKKPNEVICIGTSATLTDPGQAEVGNEPAAQRFASRLFGVAPDSVQVIGESFVKREWPQKRYTPPAPPGQGMTRLGQLLEALDEPVNLEVIRQSVQQLTGQPFHPGQDWRAELFDHLVTNDYVYEATKVLEKPKLLSDAAWQTSHRIAPDRLPQGSDSDAELLFYLILGAAAAKEGESLLRPKVHLFIRGLDEAVAAIGEGQEHTNVELFMSLAQAKERYPNRHDHAFFPVLTCRNCGQHFFENHYQELELQRRARNRLAGFENGNAAQDGKGQPNGVWATGVKETGLRLLATNRLLEEAEVGAGGGRGARWPQGWFCRLCGALHRNASKRCLADGCGNPEGLLPLTVFGDYLSSCPSCSSPALRIGGRTIEPARRMQAVTVADVHILAQAMINAAPEGHKKLIVFTDSRQDAAFQAGWMQDHARRIRLRHMMYEVIEQAGKPLSLADITDQLSQRFRKERPLIHALLPELTEEEAESRFGSNVLTATHRALRYMVLREFTTGVRRTDCLEAMGLVRVSYQGLEEGHPRLRAWAQDLEISPSEAVAAVSLLLDTWRRSRILHLRRDPIFSRYHPKDDPYIQAGLLPLRDFRPEGLVLEKTPDDKFSRGVLASRGASAVQALLKRWASDPDQLDVPQSAQALWDLLTQDLQLLTRVTLRSQKEKPLQRDNWQVDAEMVVVETSFSRQRCYICQRITTRPGPNRACMRHHCRGTTRQEEPDLDNYDVWLMGRPFVMVSAEEHTAQVPGEVRNQIENDFKSEQGRTNCLVATPTLEMGVNIGLLDMALMRNVPPRASNYWQRAGRAGREERMAVVLTYCRRSQHDRYFFEDPLRLLGGAIEAPTFNLRNPVMVAKHLRSAVLSELLLRSGHEIRVRQALKQLFPHFIRDYLLDDSQFLEAPLSTAPLEELLDHRQAELTARLTELFAQHWPEEAAELATREAIERVIADAPAVLSEVLKRLHQRLRWARSTRSDLYSKKNQGLIDREEEQLLRRCDDSISSIVRRDSSTYTLTVLAVEGFLPGYGVYEGGITASARRGFARHPGPRAFDLSRSPAIALREFVPGNRLYANRGSYYVTRYHLSAEETAGIRTLVVNPEKGFVTAAGGSAAYGHSGSLEIPALPLTDLDLAHESRITEEDSLRFSMPVSILGRLRRVNDGGVAYKIGEHEVHHLRGQGLELVNLGEASQVRDGEIGHRICSVCGAAKTPYAVSRELDHYMKIHKERCGKEPLLLALTAQAEVDMLQFHALRNEAEAVNIGESLRSGAANRLDMGLDDLQLLIVRKANETLDLLIYDPMPGGSGLLDQMLRRWQEIVSSARELLTGCPMNCETACYSCLKTFRNQFYHELLSRHEGLKLVRTLDEVPQPYREIDPLFEEQRTATGSPSNKREAQLYRILSDHHFPPGDRRKRIETSAGLSTSPDWLEPQTRTVVYLDGMSRQLHGDPKTEKRDRLIRQMLELDGYKVVVIQSRDLDDAEAMRQHLKNLAQALGRGDLG